MPKVPEGVTFRREWDGASLLPDFCVGLSSRIYDHVHRGRVVCVIGLRAPVSAVWRGPTLSNAHRAHESAVNTDSIRDELDEVITLNSVSIIVAEYIPFGANQIVQLNSNVGSTERVQGGFISPAVDEDSSGRRWRCRRR